MSDEWWKRTRWDDSDWDDSEDSSPDRFGKNLFGISKSQLNEARAIAAPLGVSFRNALISLEYVCNSDINTSHRGFCYAKVNLDNLRIPDLAIEMITESMALENMVIAIGFEEQAVTVAMPNPNDVELFDKLRSVLNRDIKVVAASLEALAQWQSLWYIGIWNLGSFGFVFSVGLHELGGLLSSWVSFSLERSAGAVGKLVFRCDSQGFVKTCLPFRRTAGRKIQQETLKRVPHFGEAQAAWRQAGHRRCLTTKLNHQIVCHDRSQQLLPDHLVRSAANRFQRHRDFQIANIMFHIVSMRIKISRHFGRNSQRRDKVQRPSVIE